MIKLDLNSYSNISQYLDMSLEEREKRRTLEKDMPKKERTRAWILLCRNVAHVLRGETAASVVNLKLKTSKDFKYRSEISFNRNKDMCTFVEHPLEEDGNENEDKKNEDEDEKTKKSWPNRNLLKDSVVAWSIMESLGILSEERHRLIETMGIAQKRSWLNRRLFRVSQSKQLPKKKKKKKRTVIEEDGTINIVEEEVKVNAAEPLAFIECNRNENIVNVLRSQFRNRTGVWDDVSGQIEVRFVGEGSSGSAVCDLFSLSLSLSLSLYILIHTYTL